MVMQKPGITVIINLNACRIIFYFIKFIENLLLWAIQKKHW